MHFRSLSLLAALAPAAVALCQVDPDRVVVKVNGTAILGRDYYKRMEVQPGMGTPTTDGKLVQVYPGYLTLRWLIEEELLVQLALSQGVPPTSAQIDAELKRRMEDNPEQLKGMLQMGFTEADMRRRVLVDLSEFNVLTKGITITDFEVEKYYKDNVSRFTLPKRYVLRIIRVVGEAGKPPVDDALAKGEKFADVASRLSTDISKLNGGLIGVVTEAEMTPSTRTVVVNTRKGSATSWLEQDGNFARFYVEDVMEPEVLTLDAKLKRVIREQLMRERGAARNNLLLLMQEFRKKAVLEFGSYPFATEIKRYFEIGG